MTEHPDCALVRQGYDAFSRGDMETLSQLMTSDVTHHVPGEHPLAGHHKGRDAVLRLYGRLAEETQGTMRVDLEGTFADGRGHVMSVHRIRADRGNMGLEERGGIFFTVIGGKISDLDECVQDMDETNRFWS